MHAGYFTLSENFLMCGSYGDDGKGYVLGGTALIAARLETRVNYCVLDSPTYRIRNTTAILGELGLQLGPCGHRYGDCAGGWDRRKQYSDAGRARAVVALCW